MLTRSARTGKSRTAVPAYLDLLGFGFEGKAIFASINCRVLFRAAFNTAGRIPSGTVISIAFDFRLSLSF